MFEFIKKMYNAGRFTAEKIELFFRVGYITETQKNDIVGSEE